MTETKELTEEEKKQRAEVKAFQERCFLRYVTARTQADEYWKQWMISLGHIKPEPGWHFIPDAAGKIIMASLALAVPGEDAQP